VEKFICDCCLQDLTKKEVQRHHLIPKLLRKNSADNSLQVNLCSKCHLAFHKIVNFADVIKKNKEYFILKYLEYRTAYLKEMIIYYEYLEEKRYDFD
jgi:hypothetical protein